MGVDLAHLEKYSNLIVVADYLGRAGPQEGSAYTYRTFQVLDVLRVRPRRKAPSPCGTREATPARRSPVWSPPTPL